MDLGYFWLSAEQFGGSNRIPQVSLSGSVSILVSIVAVTG